MVIKEDVVPIKGWEGVELELEEVLMRGAVPVVRVP